MKRAFELGSLPQATRLLFAAIPAGVLLIAAPMTALGSSHSHRNGAKQTMTALPAPIRSFIEASNRGDAAGVIACFTSTAVLDDWGRQFNGHDGIAAWDQTDNTGVQSHLEASHVEAIGGTIVVTVQVRGNGFNGTGHMHFQLTGNRIERLDIK